MRKIGLWALVTLLLLLSPVGAAASPEPADSRAATAQTQRLAGVSVRDGRDSEGFDIARVEASRDMTTGYLQAEVKFRNYYEPRVIVVWNVYLNTDRDPRPEFVVLTSAGNSYGQVFRSRGWDGLATGRPMTQCGGSVLNGLSLGVTLKLRCLGLTRTQKVSVVAQETYSVDEYDGSADDWAPGKRKWSKRF